MARGRHANPATGAFGGAPCVATILVKGVPKWHEPAMRTPPTGPSIELTPFGATVLARGVPKWPEAAVRTLLLAPSV
eukprot:3466877-Pyramimonas_sp.AAC.1